MRWDNIIQEAYFGRDGQPVLNDYGAAGAKITYDQYGNMTEIAFFGTEGQLVTVEQIGAAGRRFRYDERGNVVEVTFFDPNRSTGEREIWVLPSTTIVWDAQGRTLETFFGPDGKHNHHDESGQT